MGGVSAGGELSAGLQNRSRGAILAVRINERLAVWPWGCPLWMYRPWKKEQKTRPAAGAVAQESKTVNLVSNMEIQNDE